MVDESITKELLCTSGFMLVKVTYWGYNQIGLPFSFQIYMFYINNTFIGIDPTAGQRPFSYVALDNELKLLALGKGNIDDILAFVAGQRKAMVAVCAPQRLNQGIMANPEVRQNLSPPPHTGRWENFRLADYKLRMHWINIPQTPHKEKDCPNWMRKGFLLFRRLSDLDYKPYPDVSVERLSMEVYPHACYTVLLGVTPFLKLTLEGRIQRQLILYENGVDVSDPMRFFEEITRHRLLSGNLPFESLCTPGELDALVAAYTAWMISNRPDHITLVGDPGEGQVVVPVSEMKARY